MTRRIIFMIRDFLAGWISIRNQPLITEHKAVANSLMSISSHCIYLFSAVFKCYHISKLHVPSPFFVQHNLQYVLPRVSVVCYASGKKHVPG